MNKQQLAAKIWESANQMRSKIEANEYKDPNFIIYCKTWNKIIRSSTRELLKQKEELSIEIKEARKENLLNQYLEDVGFEEN